MSVKGVEFKDKMYDSYIIWCWVVLIKSSNSWDIFKRNSFFKIINYFVESMSLNRILGGIKI